MVWSVVVVDLFYGWHWSPQGAVLWISVYHVGIALRWRSDDPLEKVGSHSIVSVDQSSVLYVELGCGWWWLRLGYRVVPDCIGS